MAFLFQGLNHRAHAARQVREVKDFVNVMCLLVFGVINGRCILADSPSSGVGKITLEKIANLVAQRTPLMR